MRKLIKIATVMPVLLALLLAGCSLDDPADPTGEVNEPGLADAGARYAAIGNSLTAGFMDGGLMQAGQANSYPRLIANQLGLDNTQFTQPWIAAPGIGSSATGDPMVIAGVLRFDGAGVTLLGTTPAAEVQSTLLLAATQPVAYHNLGVPGALLADGRNAYSAASSVGGVPYFDFINRASLFGNSTVTLAPGLTTQSTSMHYKAIAKGGALTTVWLGNNDVLGAATSGNPGNPVPITDAGAFQAEYTAMLQSLAGGLLNRNGFPATIVTANIPSITSAPYFVPKATFETATGGAWPWGYAEGAEVAYVLFPTLSWVQNAANQGNPIPSTSTLTNAEVATIETAVATFNTVISQVTAGVNGAGIAKCAMMDANALLAGLQPAQKSHLLLLLGGGMDLPTAAGTTVFSLDGIHPNNRGYGIVANAFIDVVNSLDGTAIPAVDVAGLTWDPTYGVPVAGKTTGLPRLSPEAADGMAAIFR